MLFTEPQWPAGQRSLCCLERWTLGRRSHTPAGAGTRHEVRALSLRHWWLNQGAGPGQQQPGERGHGVAPAKGVSLHWAVAGGPGRARFSAAGSPRPGDGSGGAAGARGAGMGREEMLVRVDHGRGRRGLRAPGRSLFRPPDADVLFKRACLPAVAARARPHGAALRGGSGGWDAWAPT